MSVSSSANEGECGDNCDPFQSSASLKTINATYSLNLTFKKTNVVGGGTGGGNVSCPGGGDLSDGLADQIPGISDECVASLANQISKNLCDILGNPWPWGGPNCYNCSNIDVNVGGQCNGCDFVGSVGLDPTSTKQRCEPVDC